ncbi:glycosyltransferase [Candidatus Nitrospira bockiana]
MNVFALMATSEVSGPTRGLFQLVEQTRDKGVRFLLGMFLLGGHRTTPVIEEARSRGYCVEVLVQRRRYDPGLVRQAVRIIRRERPAIIQSHGYKPAVIAWIARSVTGVPWVAFSHGYTSEDRRITLYNRLDRWLLRRADRVVAVSEAMKRLLAASGVAPDRIHVIHNSVDPGDHPASDGRAFRRRVGVPDQARLIGVIGRLSREKGQAVFLEAFRRLAPDFPGVHAVLVGDGPDRDALQRTAGEAALGNRLLFAGHCRDIAGVYPALDLVVIPSLSEGLPNVLLEAFVYRKAVVATEVGGIPEVMRPAQLKWLVPPGDARALALAIREALSEPAACEELGARGAAYVRAQFTPAARAERVVQLYQDVLVSRSGTPDPRAGDSPGQSALVSTSRR